MPRLDKFMNAAAEVAVNGNGKSFSSPAKEKEPVNQSSDSPIDLKDYLRDPKYTLKGYIFPTDKVKQQVERILGEIKNHNLIYYIWGMAEKHKTDIALAMNISGPPGTGKSMLLEAIAHELGLKILEVPSTASKLVGDTEKIIEEIFRFATTHNAFIVWNEADRDFGKRLESVSQSADAGINSARSILLEQFSSYEGAIGLTTNFLKNYDSAFISRIRFNIQLDLPDEAARYKIWEYQLPSKLPRDESVNFSELAKQFDNTSGRDIKKAVLNGVVSAASEEKPDTEKQVTQSHFIEAMEEVIAANKAAEKEELKLTPVDGNVELPPEPSVASKPSVSS
ncbi:MAG: ATP-binding protein [Cyanobacteria bacterium P01_H01_bin.35]